MKGGRQPVGRRLNPKRRQAMKRLGRLLLCGATVLFSVASVPAATGATADLVPILPLPIVAGLGNGTWRLPAEGTGVAEAGLYDEFGTLRYVMRADMVRSGEKPPHGMPEQGGFHGVLLAVRERGGLDRVATIAGKWIREEDGSGTFGVDILVPGEGFEDPMKVVGTIEGVLHAPRMISWLVGSPRTATRTASALARLSLAWVITE
jgi:hypothetical protein